MNKKIQKKIDSNSYIKIMFVLGIILGVLSSIILFFMTNLPVSNAELLGMIGLFVALNIMNGIKLKKIQIMIEG